MSQAILFRNVESEVAAYKLEPDTSGDIGKVLGEAAKLQLLFSLTATFNTATNCHSFRFRYKDDTVDSTLEQGDYLVRLNNGKYVVYTAEDFEKEFIHTEQDLTPTKPQNIVDAFFKDMKSRYTDLALKDRDDMLARMNLVVEKLRDWYETETKTLTLRFNNYSLISPLDLQLLLNPFAKATYFTDEIRINLEFNNVGDDGKSVDRSKLNCFNTIGLQELIDTLKQTTKSVRLKIVNVSFVGVNGAPSAVAGSVLEGHWLDIIDEIRDFTGVTRNSAVIR